MTRPYTVHEWAEREALITRLYNHDRKSLKDIQVILAHDYGFFPTRSMLKKRIHKWGIDKNFKRKDMLFLHQLIIHRRLHGKNTEARIRGRTVTIRDVHRYFKRMSAQEAAEERAATTDFTPTCDIEVYTPPSTPTGEAFLDSYTRLAKTTPDLDKETLGPPHDRITSGNPVLTIPALLDNIPNTLPRLPISKSFEGVVHLVHGYYDAIFSTQGWRTRARTFQIDVLERFYRNLYAGQSELEVGNLSLAFKSVKRAFHTVHTILTDGALLFLPYLFHVLVPLASVVMLPCGSATNQDVIFSLLCYVFRLSSTILSDHHPIRRIANVLLSMSPEERSGSANHVMSQVLGRIRVQLEIGQTLLPTEIRPQMCSFTLKNKPIPLQTLIEDFAISIQPPTNEADATVYTSCAHLGPVVWTIPQRGSTAPSMTRRLSSSALTDKEEPP